MSSEILIVDDNADIRNIINELILDAGYKTRLAANYNQALSEIDKKLPDVAILDVKLDKGDNDGIELLSHIKSKNKEHLKENLKIINNQINQIEKLVNEFSDFARMPKPTLRENNIVILLKENIKLLKELDHSIEIDLFCVSEKIILNSDKEQISRVFFNLMIDRLKTQQEKLIINERHEAWGSLARKLAHEVRNPLTPIQLTIVSFLFHQLIKLLI